MAEGNGDYEFTKPPGPGEANKVSTPGKPSQGKEVDKDKCPRCRKAGTLRDRKTGLPCCPKMVRVCEDCGNEIPK